MQEFEAMVCCLLLFNGRFVWYQLLIPTIMCSRDEAFRDHAWLDLISQK